MTAPPEFSRIERLDEIGRVDWPRHIEANADERAALARRFGFSALDRLEANYSLSRDSGAIRAAGELRALLSQPCIATGEPVAETVHESFAIRFVPEDREAAHNPDEELEIDAEDCDTLTYSGNRIDMGDAVAETLALSINPYPRSTDADRYLREAGVLTEERAGPFAALATLKPHGKK